MEHNIYTSTIHEHKLGAQTGTLRILFYKMNNKNVLEVSLEHPDMNIQELVHLQNIHESDQFLLIVDPDGSNKEYFTLTKTPLPED